MRLMGFRYRHSPRNYAIDLQKVYRILDGPAVHQVPWSRSYLRGICRLDRWVVPVIDLRELLDDVQGEVTSVLIVYAEGEVLVGFPVGEVFPSFGRADIQRVVRQAERPLCPYVLHTKQGVFHFIDMKTLLFRHFGELWQ
jgi:chemotaxis signal transduction protein